MKILKIISITSLVLLPFFSKSVMTEEQFTNQLFQELSNDITQMPVQDLTTFAESPEGLRLRERLALLPDRAPKNRLLQRLYEIPGGNPIYPAKRPFYGLLVNSGAAVNHNFNDGIYRKTLLSEATRMNDLEMVNFLLDNGAITTDTDYNHGPLLVQAKTLPLATVLVDHGALEPYASKNSLQHKLLKKVSAADYDQNLAPFYRKELVERFGCTVEHKKSKTPVSPPSRRKPLRPVNRSMSPIHEEN